MTRDMFEGYLICMLFLNFWLNAPLGNLMGVWSVVEYVSKFNPLTFTDETGEL